MWLGEPVVDVLVVEDEADIAQPLARALRREGYAVDTAVDGPDALRRAAARPFDLVVLDLGLPGMDGLDVCRRLREMRPSQLILMLTARGDEIDIVVGLDAGADDYVAKPFRVAELLARVRAVLRRGDAPGGEMIVAGEIRVERRARRVWRAEREIDLAPKEFDLLTVLLDDIGAVVTRERLIDLVWDTNWYGPTKMLDIHMSSLRRKLGDDPAEPRFIRTVRGVGYRFERQ
jgi:DNA-binding response OmpR family regulator